MNTISSSFTPIGRSAQSFLYLHWWKREKFSFSFSIFFLFFVFFRLFSSFHLIDDDGVTRTSIIVVIQPYLNIDLIVRDHLEDTFFFSSLCFTFDRSPPRWTPLCDNRFGKKQKKVLFIYFNDEEKKGGEVFFLFLVNKDISCN